MSHDPRQGLRRTTTPHNVPHAALYGAFKAFHNPIPAPKPEALQRTSTGNSMDHRSYLNRPTQPVSRNNTGASVASRVSYLNAGSTLRRTNTARSPQRNDSMMKEQDDTGVKRKAAVVAGQEVVALPSAKAIAKQFEAPEGQEVPTPSQVPKRSNTPDIVLAATKIAPPIVSPKPRRTLSVKAISTGLETGSGEKGGSEVVHLPKREGQVSNQIVTIAPTTLDIKPKIPPPRRSGKPAQAASEPSKQLSPPSKTLDTTSLREALESTKASRDARSLSPPMPTRQMSRSPNLQQYKHQSMKQIAPFMSDNTLANAMMGANLAIKSLPQSRNQSPQRGGAPRLPSPRRKKHSGHRGFLGSRSPSPANGRRQGMQTTLRREESTESDSSGERHGFRHLVNKHPNKHNEGTRKHWRDTISPTERKLYEGLWATNKGLYMNPASSTSSSYPDTANEVLDIVVREIWSRSEMLPSLLEEVWALVDRRGIRRLTREEFVVGLWLIDQRLKGRRLPSKVADSVWESVTGLGIHGVKIRIEPNKKTGKLEKRQGGARGW